MISWHAPRPRVSLARIIGVLQYKFSCHLTVPFPDQRPMNMALVQNSSLVRALFNGYQMIRFIEIGIENGAQFRRMTFPSDKPINECSNFAVDGVQLIELVETTMFAEVNEWCARIVA